MTELSFRAIDLTEKQQAFTGLLATPVVTPWTDPILHALVTRHERALDTWARRMGHRLQRIDRCLRLRRPPIDGVVAVPRGPAPKRRPLIYALVLAAALEDLRQESVTLQELSDEVRRGTAAHGLTTYDPTQRAHRSDLLEAVKVLISHGALEQRTHRPDLIDSWEREGAGIGAGYLRHREALVLLVDTHDAELALAPEPSDGDQRGHRLLRMLVETQALHPLELNEDDRSYLTGQRSRLVAQAEEMTGGTVEVRSDVWLLVLPGDRGLPPSLFVPFPQPAAADWVSLAMLDAVTKTSETDGRGRRRGSSSEVDDHAATLFAEHGTRLTTVMREGGSAEVRAAAERQLTSAGLLELAEDGDWWLLPAAARYRDADLTAAGAAEPASTLFEDDTPDDDAPEHDLPDPDLPEHDTDEVEA